MKTDIIFGILFALIFIVYIYLLRNAYFPINVWAVIIFSLATFRVVRLITSDSITQPLRNVIENSNLEIVKYISRLISCPWCLSIWVAPAVMVFGFLNNLTVLILFTLAISAIASLLINLSKRIVR